MQQWTKLDERLAPTLCRILQINEIFFEASSTTKTLVMASLRSGKSKVN